MRRFVDLHTHSTASDGQASPEELIHLANRAKLAMVALTDHDTTAGLAAARCCAEQYPDLRFLCGIEISAVYPGGTLHILGLDIDETHPRLRELTERLRESRELRNPKIIEKLQALGLPLDMEDVLAEVRGTRDADRRIVSRMHIAQALLRKGCVQTVWEAFDRYVGQGAAAYVDKERTPPREAIGIIREAGGVAALAHPPQLKYRNLAEFQRVMKDFVQMGLNGLECYHSDNSPEQTREYLDLSRRMNLLVTGGSDFHGSGKPRVQIGHPRTPVSMLQGQLADAMSR